MGYISRQQYYQRAYVPDTAIVTSNDAEKKVLGLTYTLSKEITLVAPIYSGSQLRVYYETKIDTPPNVVTSNIFRNGIAIGTERTNNTNGYIAYEEDLPTIGWKIGDKIQIWEYDTFIVLYAYCRNFRIKGVGSEFVNTVV